MSDYRQSDDCSAPDNQRASLIEHVLLVHLQQRLQGEHVVDDELLAQYPELLPELADRLQSFREIADQRAANVALESEDLERFIAHYRIMGKLGAGGMGEVLLAEDTKLGRKVALKLLPIQVANDSQRRQRFITEAKAASALNHPNVCTIYEVGETEDQQPFIAMEYLAGQTLDEHGSLKISEITNIGVQLADALDAAHSQGIVHRDIKPSNISINERGQVKVLDFGLAKRVTAGLSVDEEAATQYRTQDGQVLGTPNFMSPEQALGKAADHRTDIFSFGVVLYQLTTGQLPFAGSNALETRNKIVNAQPRPIARLNDDTPPELERIILKCLEKDAERRYQTASELLVDLRKLNRSLEPGQTRVAQAGTGEVVTLLYIDVADVNALKSSLGAQKAAHQIESLHQTIRQKLKAFSHAAQIEAGGDAVLLTFSKPSEALQFAIEMQGHSARQVKCRIGIDLGEVMRTESTEPKQRFGQHLNTCASLMQLAGPGRVLMGRAVFDSARQVLKLDSVSWANHGTYALKGIDEPIEVCEVASGKDSLDPPSNTEVGQRKVTADEEPVLGWRPAVGQRVPNTPWRLEKKLGEGGFGEVWLGTHQKLKEQRVFKFCFRADRVRSLKREVTLFRILRDRVGHHRGIVGIQDVYFDEPPFYLVMDYADGIALKPWCGEQGGVVNVPEEVRLEIVAQVAQALQAAHDAGVIHRDVKPGNILVSYTKSEGRRPKLEAKLTDFGIGQIISEEILADVTNTGFTQSIVADSSSSKSGTLLYMAPEVLSGNPASIRSDIYSLGVVLYQLLVGDFARPITTDWSAAIADPLLREDLEHCFAGDPQQRFAGAAQLASHLRALPQRRTARAEQQAAMASQARAAYRRGVFRTVCVAAAIVMAMAALALWAIGSQRQMRRIAETRRQELYAAQIGLAHQAWVEGDLERAQALLEAQRPAPNQTDLRGFEWRYLWRLCRDESRLTLTTFNDGAGPLGVSSDGIKLAMATGKIMKVWDFAGKRELASLEGHTEDILALVFSPTNPDLLATGAYDGTIKLWDLSTSLLVDTLGEASLPGATNVNAIAFSPNGSRLAAVRSNGQVELWELATRRLAWSTQRHGGRDPALCVAFSSDGRLATGGGDTKVRLWNVATGEQDGPLLEGHTAWVFWLKFSPDGRLLATGGNDGLVLLWDVTDVTTRQIVSQLLGHNGGVKSGAFSPDGRTLVSGGSDQTIRLWNVAASKQIRMLRGHSASVHSLAFSPDGQSLVSASEDHTVKLWDTSAQHDRNVLTNDAGWVETVALSPDGKTLALSDYHALAVNLWDVPSRRLIMPLLVHTGIPRCLTFSPDGKLLASGGDMHQDGKLLASGGDDQTVRVWDLSQHTEIAYQCGFGVRSVAFSSDGTILSAAGNGLKFWELASGREIDLIQGDTRSTRFIAFASRGGLLATSDQDDNLSVWDANDGKEKAQFMVERSGSSSSGNYRNLSFSSDGRFVALGKADGTVILFDVTRAKKPQRLDGHTGQVFSVMFTPDSKTLASASEDGTVRLWNVASGQSALTLHHVGPITGVSFSGDGTLMATSGADGTVRLWPAASLSEADAPR